MSNQSSISQCVRDGEPINAGKRDSLRKVGQIIVTSTVFPALGLLSPRPAVAALWVVPTIAFLAGYGFSRLWDALKRSDQRHAQERLRNRMAGFDFPMRDSISRPDLFLGPASASTDLVSRLHWPEWGYHDAKIKEGASFRYPASPKEGLASSDKQIFEEAMGRRVAGLMRNGEAYARDYRDREGKNMRVVAARLHDGQTVVAESDGRNATAYEIKVGNG